MGLSGRGLLLIGGDGAVVWVEVKVEGVGTLKEGVNSEVEASTN